MTDPRFQFETAYNYNDHTMELDLWNYPKFSELLNLWPGTAFEGKTYAYPTGTQIKMSVTMEICDENNYWHVLVPYAQATKALTFDFSFEIK